MDDGAIRQSESWNGLAIAILDLYANLSQRRGVDIKHQLIAAKLQRWRSELATTVPRADRNKAVAPRNHPADRALGR
jgi:hypothetical protein